MSYSGYTQKKLSKGRVRDYYKKQNIVKTGVKNLPKGGMTGIERKEKGHQWDKFKDSNGSPRWKNWGVLQKEEVKFFGQSRYDKLNGY